MDRISHTKGAGQVGRVGPGVGGGGGFILSFFRVSSIVTIHENQATMMRILTEY
jgi:hypothetical protein